MTSLLGDVSVEYHASRVKSKRDGGIASFVASAGEAAERLDAVRGRVRRGSR